MIISALRGIFLGLSNLVDLLANGGYCPSLSSPQTGTPRAYTEDWSRWRIFPSETGSAKDQGFSPARKTAVSHFSSPL